MTVKFTNNASSTLSSGINSSVTSLTVASASAFPQLAGADDYCYLTIQQATGTAREVVKATALSSNTFTIIRAQDNTTAQSFSAGDTVELRMTAALLTDVIDAATVEGVKTNFQYTPTAGQTVFSGADNSSNTMIINQSGLVNVFMNGVRLVQGTDYTVSAANNEITLTTGATTADIIDIEVYGNFTGQSGAAVAITGGSITGTAITATTLGASGTATLNTFVSNNATISGGTINNVAIGGTTQAAGNFTDITAASLVVDTTTLVVDATNNRVGIGTSSAQAKLDVSGVGNFSTGYNTFTGDGLHIQCSGTGGNGNYTGGISFSRISSDNDSRAAGIAGVQGADADQVGLAFFTHPSATTTGSLAEAMRIDSSGNVGIGVVPSTWSAAWTALDIGDGTLFSQNNRTTGLGSNIYFTGSNWFPKETGESALYQISQGTHIWYANSSLTSGVSFTPTPKMTLDASGNLIVGGTSDGAAGSITLQGDGDIRGVLSSGAGGDTLISAISGVSNGYQISVTTGNAQTYKWHNGGTPSMTLDASGNLLVGTTALTDIDSSGTGNEGAYIKADGQIGLASSNQVVAIFNRKTIDGDIVEFRKNGSPVGSIGTEGGDLAIGNADAGLQFINGTQSVRPFNMTTNARIDAQVDLGMSTTRFKDLYLSGGVNFGDAGGSGTPSSNLLDDYEEGTWTPTVLYGSTGVSVVISRSKYVKIGSMVTVSATLGITSSPSAGAMSIQNLPFSSSVNVETTGSIMLYNVDFDVDTVNVVTYQYNSANKIDIYATKDNSPWYRLNHSNIGNGDSIIFTHTYFTS